MQQTVHVLPRRVRLLLRRLDLREPALLDHDQRGLETLRQRRTPDRAVQRLPAIGQIRVVDGRAGGELLGFDDQRLGALERMVLTLPGREALLGLGQRPRAPRRRCAPVPPRAARPAPRAARQARPSRPGGCSAVHPFAQPALELRACPLLVLLAVEARLQRLPGRVPARSTHGVAAHVERLPAPIDFHRCGEDRAGLWPSAPAAARERHRPRTPAPRARRWHRRAAGRAGPRHGPCSSPRGELAQALRRVNPLRGVHARLRVLGRKRQLDQQVFIAKARQSHPSPLGIGRAAGHFGAYRIGAGVAGKERRGARVVRRFRKHLAQRRREGQPERSDPIRLRTRRRAPGGRRSDSRPRRGPPPRGRRQAAARVRRNPVATPPHPARAAQDPDARAAPNGKRAS